MPEPSQPARPPSIRRMIGIGLAVLIPVVPIVVALILFHGSGTTVTVTQTTPSASAPTTSSGSSTTPQPSQPVSRIPSGKGALVAYVAHGAAVYARPDGHEFATLKSTTTFNSPAWVLVDHVKGQWLRVVNNAVGNNKVGWIREARATVLKRIPWSIHVRLSQHMLLVQYDHKTVEQYRIADGMPTAPTPTGRFAVTDRLTTGDPNGPYGCCILGTSATAPHHISDWDGGNRIAIHSTPTFTYDQIGESISHGCMHVTLPEGRWLLKHIPLGTPVDISSA